MSRATDAQGRPASGIPAVDCPDWCEDPGHVAEIFQADQNCRSAYTTIELGMEYMEVSGGSVAYSVVAAMAYRGFNQHPVVHLYLSGFKPTIDTTITLTVAEARRLCDQLDRASDTIGEL